MIKVNLLRDYTTPVEKQPVAVVSSISRVGYAYIAAIISLIAVPGYLWISSGIAINAAAAANQRLESDMKEMESLRNQFVELNRKKQERQGRINIIEKLLESQKVPVKLLNVVIQSIPQNREIWLTSLEQTDSGVNVRGETLHPEILPDFMENLAKSGIFAGIDIEQIERRNEISNFSILCAGKQ